MAEMSLLVYLAALKVFLPIKKREVLFNRTLPRFAVEGKSQEGSSVLTILLYYICIIPTSGYACSKPCEEHEVAGEC